MSERTRILFGPPGTGKTTALLREVEGTLARGSSPDRIGFFAFTRKAAGEAVSRAVKQFGVKKDDLPWFRTLHSAAFRMLSLSSNDVMQNAHYAELADSLGRFTFQHSYNEDTERVPQGGALGDLALGVYTRARSRMTSIRNEWAVTDEDNLTLDDAELFAAALDNYKSAYQLLDFSDFLDEVHHPLDLDLMIIDEAQDLTLQQWAFARRMGERAKRVIIAGDDDQAIFSWSGADVESFMSFNGEKIVLPVSYRLPLRVFGKCISISDRIKVRVPKQWSPRPEDVGSVSYVDDIDHVALRDDKTWLLLSRMRWQYELLETACRDQGVVYQKDGIWSNQTPEVRAVINYERLRRGDTLTGSAVDSIVRYVPGLSDFVRQSEMSWADVKWPFEGMPDWMTALAGLGADEREYIRRVRRNNESLNDPGRVVISTIHGVKGGEADNVFVLPDISKRIDSAMDKDLDSEYRVWYVAASRAKHNLMIARPMGLRSIDI